MAASMSYDDLPYHLKPCFLYLGNFSKDFDIIVKRLIQLWISEGFISSAQFNKDSVDTMEDVAYAYLNELVERCVVQVGAQRSVRNIKTCRIHDLMRDLCFLKAEENFLQVVKFSDKNQVIGKVRRLTIYLDKEDKFVSSKDERDAAFDLYYTSAQKNGCQKVY